MLSLMMETPQEIMQSVADRAKARRLAQKLTQMGLAEHSGVSLGTIKRFERTSKIALESLLKIAMALDCLEDFKTLFPSQEAMPSSIDELLKTPKTRKRGSVT